MLMNQFLSNPRPRASRLDFIRRVWRDHELSCVKLCDLLEESFRMKDHVEVGCGRFDDFAENEFGVPARQAWTFVHLGQRLVELPETRKALLNGIIGYTKAREFASIATVDTEREWIDFAAKHSSRALERRVRMERSGSPEEQEKFAAFYGGLEMQVIEQAWHEAKRETGRTMALSEILPFLATRYLEGKLPDARRKLLGFTVLQACPFCLDTWVPTRTGNLRAAVARLVARLGDPDAKLLNLLDEQLCGCHGSRHRADLCPENSCSPIHDAKLDVSRYVRKDVLYRVWLRDGGRCRVPGCTTSGEPENSHIRAVRFGGPAEPWNLVTMCGHCNDLYEKGRLEITGTAPFEGYWREGKFIGMGYDPEYQGEAAEAAEAAEAVPAEAALSHTGHSPPGDRPGIDAAD